MRHASCVARQRLWALAGLAFAVFVVWRGTLQVPVQFDDEEVVGRERFAQPFLPVRELARALRAPFGRHLTTWSFRADHALWGYDPPAFHAAGLLIHLLSAWLVWELARRGLEVLWGGSGALLGAWTAALVFALHPVQAETVLYLSARSTLLATLAALSAVLAADEALSRRRQGRPHGGVFACLSACCAVGSVWAMPWGLVTPAIVVAWLAGVRGVSRRALAAAVATGALFILAFSGEISRFLCLRQAVRPPGYSKAYWLTQPECLLRGLRLLAAPAGLRVDHDVTPVGVSFTAEPLATPFGEEAGPRLRHEAALASEAWSFRAAAVDPRLWGPLLVILGVGSALVWAFGRLGTGGRRALAVGTAAFGLSWLPGAAAPLEDLFFEHRMYPALAWAAWLAGFAVVWAWRRAFRERPALGLSLAVAALSAWGWMDHARIRIWRDPGRLWADALRRSPAKARPHFNLATSWYRSEAPPLSEVQRLCLAASASFVRYRDNANLLAEIHNLMGGTFRLRGELENAYVYHRLASTLAPGAWEFRFNLAMSALEIGRNEEAARLFGELSRARPCETEFRMRWATVLDDLGRLAEARDVLASILAQDPAHDGAAVTLAWVLVRMGRFQEAIELAGPFAAQRPSAPILYNLALALERAGRTDEARQALTRAFRLDPALVGPENVLWKRLAGAEGTTEKK